MEITPDTRINCVTHTDADGIFCGLILKSKYPQAIVYQSNYGKAMKREWLDCDVLFVTDFSFDGLETLKRLENDPRFKFIWIDHHIIIDEAAKSGFNPEGLRNKDVSATHLMWQYLYPNEPIPKVVKLVSDYDTWEWAKNGNTDALYFNYALRLCNIEVNKKSSIELFKEMLNDQFVEKFINGGMCVSEYIDRKADVIAKDLAFRTEIEGVDAIACNCQTGNSLLLEEYAKTNPTPFRIMFAYVGSLEQSPERKPCRVSIYSTDPKKYSAYDICKKYGGGGHAGAAGFTCRWEDLPFRLPSNISFDHDPVETIANDVYKDMTKYVSPIQDAYSRSGEEIIVRAYSHESSIGPLKACCVNDPFMHSTAFVYTLKHITHHVGICYHLNNKGQWIYRIHPFMPEGSPLMNEFAELLQKDNLLCGPAQVTDRIDNGIGADYLLYIAKDHPRYNYTI